MHEAYLHIDYNNNIQVLYGPITPKSAKYISRYCNSVTFNLESIFTCYSPYFYHPPCKAEQVPSGTLAYQVPSSCDVNCNVRS